MKNWLKLIVEIEGKIGEDHQGLFVKVREISLKNAIYLLLTRRFFIRFKK